jgi:hypothetical protein
LTLRKLFTVACLTAACRQRIAVKQATPSTEGLVFEIIATCGQLFDGHLDGEPRLQIEHSFIVFRSLRACALADFFDEKSGNGGDGLIAHGNFSGAVLLQRTQEKLVLQRNYLPLHRKEKRGAKLCALLCFQNGNQSPTKTA